MQLFLLELTRACIQAFYSQLAVNAAASDLHSAEIKPSVNPAVDIVCMDGWSMWPCALLQNEETVRPVDLQQPPQDEGKKCGV